MRSLFFTGFSVDSPLGSFFPVLPLPPMALFLVRKYSSSGLTRKKSLKIPNDLLEEVRKLTQLLLLFLGE
jgi:hypothetical protein